MKFYLKKKVLIGSQVGQLDAYSVSPCSLNTTNNSILTSHTDNVNQIIRINLNQVASVSSDMTLKVWNIINNTLVNSYSAHTAAVLTLAVLPNGLLASGGADSTIRLWNMQTQTVTTISTLDTVSLMMINPVDGSLVTVSSLTGLISVYSPTALALIQSYSSGRQYNDMEILLPSGNLLLAGLYSDVYNRSTLNLTSNSSLSSILATKIKLLPDSITVVIGCASGQMALFDSNTSSLVSSGFFHSDKVNVIVITPDQHYVVSGADDLTLIFWLWASMQLTYFTTVSFVFGMPRSGLFIQTSFTGSN
jgi:WD40 repeat protein